MLRKLIKRTLEIWHDEGFMRVWALGTQLLMERSRFLTYEPACAASPRLPCPTFERGDGSARIAVHIHMYYVELLDEMITYTNHIPYRFDCYISTDTNEKAQLIRERFMQSSHAQNTEVCCFENRGRDVAPFIQQLSPVLSRYDYILHLHTKYSVHDDFGNKWRSHLLNTLLGSTGHVAALLATMEERENLGIVFQRTFWRVKPSLGWKGNQESCVALLKRMGIAPNACQEPQFPAGNMFWAKTAAIAPVFQCGITPDDFEAENHQLDGTLAHSIERCWALVAQAGGKTYMRIKAPSSVKNGSVCK